jgi:hypothetical protein
VGIPGRRDQAAVTQGAVGLRRGPSDPTELQVIYRRKEETKNSSFLVSSVLIAERFFT